MEAAHSTWFSQLVPFSTGKIKRSFKSWAPHNWARSTFTAVFASIGKDWHKPPLHFTSVFSSFLSPLWFHSAPLLPHVASFAGFSSNLPACSSKGEPAERQGMLLPSQWTCLLSPKGTKKNRRDWGSSTAWTWAEQQDAFTCCKKAVSCPPPITA